MRRALPAALLLLVVAGCNIAGTTAIRNGRAAYNDAITATNNEQLLAKIVGMRYQEPTGLLSVASVTANVRIQASVGSEFGVGPNSNYSGNLVPLRAGVLYEENPTISYTPVAGQNHLRLLFAPLPMSLVASLMRTMGHSRSTMTLLIMEINGTRNPVYTEAATPDELRRFAEIADLFTLLHRRGRLIWTQVPGDDSSFGLLLRGEDADALQEIVRLHELLGLDPPQPNGKAVTLQVALGVGGHGGDRIELMTRSGFDLLQVAAASVEVPEEHLESGLASPLPPRGPVCDEIRIRHSSSPPEDALVAVRRHGWWFWIDAKDGRSKESFRLLEAIASSRIADATEGRSRVPVLTVPVSR